MKKWVSFILVCGVLLLPSTVLARLGAIPIVQIVYTDLGDTTGGRLSSGKLLVETVRMSGGGIVDCGGRQECMNTGLDGHAIDNIQKLRIVIDANDSGVQGRATGRIIAVELDAGNKLKFKGRINGEVTCVGGPQRPCTVLELDMLLRARLVDADMNSLAGVLEFELIGILSPGDGDTLPPSWTSLEGNGALAIFITPPPG